MTEFIVSKYGEKWGTQSIEVYISSTNGTYKFQDDSIIRGKRVLGMFVLNNEDDTAVAPSGRPLASDEAIRSSYITLKMNNDEVIFEHPLSDFLESNGDRSIRMLNMCNLNPSKSEIKVGDPTLVSVGESFLLQFIYEK